MPYIMVLVAEVVTQSHQSSAPESFGVMIRKESRDALMPLLCQRTVSTTNPSNVNTTATEDEKENNPLQAFDSRETSNTDKQI